MIEKKNVTCKNGLKNQKQTVQKVQIKIQPVLFLLLKKVQRHLH